MLSDKLWKEKRKKTNQYEPIKKSPHIHTPNSNNKLYLYNKENEI